MKEMSPSENKIVDFQAQTYIMNHIDKAMTMTMTITSPTKKRRIDSSSSTNLKKPNSNIRVVTRVRPFSSNEIKIQQDKSSSSINHPTALSIVTKNVIQVVQSSSGSNNNRSNKIFEYDTVLNTNSSQKEVYETVVGVGGGDCVGENVIHSQIMRGFNVTILAYGQTGSGKTFTMGTDGENHNYHADADSDIEFSPPRDTDGIIPRAVFDLFASVREYNAKLGDNCEKIKVELSYLEIYNEECRDLLNVSEY